MTQSAVSYDPTQKYEVKVSDVEFLSVEGNSFMATIYQPQGTGPFPAFLDVHGGAWSGGTRTAAENVDRALATSGMVVAAIDFRVAPEHAYPKQVMDVNYGIRWWKATCGDYNGDASKFGALGISSGGHTTMLTALKPNDERYAALPLPGHEDVDASLDYVIGASPVLDSYARYLYAKEEGNEHLVSGSFGYFIDEETMKEGSPQLVVERGEQTHMPPVLVIHATSDQNVPNHIPTRFEETYRAAGGSIELKLFPDMHHSFVRDPSPETDVAIGMMKEFIARQLSAS